MEGICVKIILNLFEAFVILSAFLVLSRRHKYLNIKNIGNFFFLVSYSIYSIIFSNLLPKGLDTVLILFLTIFLLICLFDSNAFRSIIKCCIVFCGIFIVETLVLIIFALFFGADTQMQMKNNTLLVFNIGLFVKVIELVAVYILYRTDFWSSWLDQDGKKDSGYWQMLVIVACCGAIIVTMIVAMCVDNSIKVYYGIASGVICIIMFGATLMTFKEVKSVERMKYENIAVHKSVAQMKEFNDLMAKERHEYKNHLSTIYGLCCLRKQDTFDRIKSYIDEYARINQHIIATIIANITQNAVEAITLAGMTDRYINISGKIVGKNYEILISNNGPIISYDIQKRIFDSGFSTKSKIDEDRGFGLSIVKNHIEACNGTIIISSTEQETRFIIRLPLNKSKKYKQTNLMQTKENWI